MKKQYNKRFNVTYAEIESREAIVFAKNKEDAKEKVREVVGDVEFGGIYEIKEEI